MPKIFFDDRDLLMLRELSDAELYTLNEKVLAKVHDVKANISMNMFSKETIFEIVEIAETTAAEILRRCGGTPQFSTGAYNRTGITYDTPEYRHWLRKNRGIDDVDTSFLKSFSFWEELSTI